MNWTPRVFTSRRIAGRVLRNYRDGVIELCHEKEHSCIEGITARFLSTNLRKKLGKMWVVYGVAIVDAGQEDPEKRTEVDDALDSLVSHTSGRMD